MNNIEGLVRRFVVEVCQGLLHVDSTLAATTPEETSTVRFVHKLVFSKINPARFTDPNLSTSSVPPLNKSVSTLTELIQAGVCPDPEAAECAIRTLLKSRLLRKKPEVLHLVLLLCQNTATPKAEDENTPVVRDPKASGERTLLQPAITTTTTSSAGGSRYPSSTGRADDLDRTTSDMDFEPIHNRGLLKPRVEIERRRRETERRMTLFRDPGQKRVESPARHEPISAWRAPSGPLNSLHRQYSGPSRGSRGPMTPASPTPSLQSTHTDWRLMPEARKNASNKVQAAMSIFPTPRESVALIRDVVFCLQGIDGQHLRYDPHYQRFLLRREIPLSRPIRILASRMVAPGNVFMQIHLATSNVTPKQCKFGGQTLTSIPRLNDQVITSSWKNRDGYVEGEECKKLDMISRESTNSDTFRFLIPPGAPYRLREHVPSLTVFAFLQHVRDTLSLYYKELGALESDLVDLEQSEGVEAELETLPAPRTVFSSRMLRKLIIRLRPALKRLHCLASIVSATAGQIGGELPSTIDEMRKHGNPTRSAVAHEAFEKAVVPLIEFVRDWLLEGKLVDEYNEFFIKSSSGGTTNYYASWRDGLKIDWSLVPTFFTTECTKQIMTVGKMAYFIRLINGPGHFEQFKSKRMAELAIKEATLLSVVPISDIPSVVVRAMDDVHAQFSMTGTDTNANTPMNYRVETQNDDMSCDGTMASHMNTPGEQGLSSDPLHSLALRGWPSPQVAALVEDLEMAEKAHRQDLRHILIERFRLVDHLNAIKSFILLGTGDFAESLMEETAQLIIQTGSVVSIVQSEIDTCIEKAVRGSVAARCNPELVNRLHAIRMIDQERFGHSNWDFFALDYELADNPVSVVIRDELRTQYRRLFAFLWKIRRTTKLQHSIWLTTMHNSFLLSFPEVFEILLDVQSLRNEIMHLLQSIESFVFLDVIQPAFEIMIQRVKEDKWADLDELIEIQESFVQTLLYGTFLDDWPTPNTIGPRVELTPADLRPDCRRSRSGTLPDVHSAFLSSSCALPSFFSTRKKAYIDHLGETEPHVGQGPQLIDDLLECAASFADLMDYLQIVAYDRVKLNLEVMEKTSVAFAKIDQSEAGTTDFFRQHISAVEGIRDQFTKRLFAFLEFLKDMKVAYRSDAISALLVRLDLNDYYDKLKTDYTRLVAEDSNKV